MIHNSRSGGKNARFRVLLVYPNLQMVNLLPSNIAVLSAVLKKHNMDVKVFDTTHYRITEKSVDDIRVEHMQLRPFNLKEKGIDYKKTNVFEDFRKLVDAYSPDVIGVSATDDTYELGIALVSHIEKGNIHVIIGGIHPTFCPEEVIREGNVDSVCIGEGEEAFRELCQNLQAKKDITKIKNIWVKKNRRIYKNKLRKPVDINKIPYEDFSVFEEKRLLRPMQGKVFKMIPISPDRGCPFSCAFCAAPALRDLYSHTCKSPYFRVKTVRRLMDELKHQVAKYKADYIYFNSETFFARRKSELSEFASEYAKNIGLPFWCQTHIETITEDKIKLLEDMNCDRISVGIEHGNEKFRRKVLKKKFSNRQVIEAFKVLEKSTISVTVNNIIGFPDETRELVFDTIELNRQIHADSINTYFFVPYNGTPLRQYCIDKGYLDPLKGTDTPMRSSILKMPQLLPGEIEGLVKTFPLYVKFPKSYLKRIRLAEQPNEQGSRMLDSLKEVYFREYFK